MAAVAELLGGPTALALFGVLLGAILGSFLNVVAHRLPRQLDRESQAWARDLLGLDPEASEPIFAGKQCIKTVLSEVFFINS